MSHIDTTESKNFNMFT